MRRIFFASFAVVWGCQTPEPVSQGADVLVAMDTAAANTDALGDSPIDSDSADAEAVGPCGSAMCGNGVCNCGETGTTCPADCSGTCGNGVCAGEETVDSCPADCAFLAAHTAGPCSKPGEWDTCADGYICVARSQTGGGNVCVAMFDSWRISSDARLVNEFAVNDSYVTDSLTGLSWAKESTIASGLASALSACVAQNIGGFDDWRPPTVGELGTLIDYTLAKPASAAAGLSWSASRTYWGVGPAVLLPSTTYWFVNFIAGGTWLGDTSSLLDVEVRCVRGGVGAAAGSGSRYALSADGFVVLDRMTGLHWQTTLYDTYLKTADQKVYCAANKAGLPGTAWRLPSIRELRSLVDYRRSQPALDPAFGKSLWVPRDNYSSHSATIRIPRHA